VKALRPREDAMNATFRIKNETAILLSANEQLQHEVFERKKAKEKIHDLAFYDTLTNLPNRRMLIDRLGKAMAYSERTRRNAALMFLDLDNFKALNDTHGHDVGDLLLIEVARRVTGCIREVDTVARFGGDEFVSLLVEFNADKTIAAEQAHVVAEKIRVCLEKPYLLAFGQKGAQKTVEHHCTASIGVALFIGKKTQREDILKCADIAMYQAKNGGRNRIQFYEP
jgi:diguanylate cyclase (GGDEF)-like protein